MVATRLPNAEVQVGRLDRASPGTSHRAETLAGNHRLAGAHGQRPQVEIGEIEATVGGADADGQARRAREPGEGHLPGRGRHHRLTLLTGDVDAAVLAGRVGVVAVAVRRQDLPDERPRPVSGGRGRQGEQERGKQGGRGPAEEASHGAAR
jgi:hypothetical protein